jgi:bla regulator protein blaR1
VFEVATIKPSNPAAQGKLLTIKGRQVLTINTSLSDLISYAYGLHTRQVVGGPSWMGSDKYDITGQPEGQGMPNLTQMRDMIRALLVDRFKLTTHRETRELPAYALVVAPGGPKMTKNESNPNGLPGLLFRGLGVLPATNATMGDFAGVMQLAVLDRPVIDRTGLQGRWDFTLTWTPDETQFASFGLRIPPSTDPNAPPVLFTAAQEQLGLKFDSVRAPVEVLVIDRVEKPSEN